MTSGPGRIAILALTAALLIGCVPMRGGQRAATLPVSCVRSALQQGTAGKLPDKQAHCRATASIAERCSAPEAYAAGLLKEFADLFGPGNAEWADWRADRRGVRCARAASGEEDIARCCGELRR